MKLIFTDVLFCKGVLSDMLMLQDLWIRSVLSFLFNVLLLVGCKVDPTATEGLKPIWPSAFKAASSRRATLGHDMQVCDSYRTD